MEMKTSLTTLFEWIFQVCKIIDFYDKLLILSKMVSLVWQIMSREHWWFFSPVTTNKSVLKEHIALSSTIYEFVINSSSLSWSADQLFRQSVSHLKIFYHESRLCRCNPKNFLYVSFYCSFNSLFWLLPVKKCIKSVTAIIDLFTHLIFLILHWFFITDQFIRPVILQNRFRK